MLQDNHVILQHTLQLLYYIQTEGFQCYKIMMLYYNILYKDHILSKQVCWGGWVYYNLIMLYYTMKISFII